MAYQELSSTKQYVGLSTDTKPTAPDGSRCYELDTGKVFQCKAGTWYEVSALPAGTNNIGDVDVASIAAGDTNIGNVDLASAIPAGEAHVGEVGGSGKSVTVALSVTNGAYTAKDVAGGLITFANAVRANGKHAVVNSVKLDGVVALAYNLHFINADIATPAADNAPFALAAADMAKMLGWVSIGAGDYVADSTGGFNMATVRNVGLQVKAAAGTSSIYAYLVAQATTSPDTTTLQLTVDFEYLD